jgi:hypothetical protein
MAQDSRHDHGVHPSPAIRAGAVRDSLDNLDEFEPGARAAVLERVPPGSRELILSAPRSDWISIEHDHYTVDAIVQRFGRLRAIDYWCFSLRRLIDRPLLRNFVSGMVNVLGREPPIVVGFLVKGWGLAYRDLCKPVLVSVDGQPAIRFEEVAPEVRRYSHYFASWDGTCRGFAHVARVKGDVHFSVEEDGQSALAVFYWK